MNNQLISWLNSYGIYVNAQNFEQEAKEGTVLLDIVKRALSDVFDEVVNKNPSLQAFTTNPRECACVFEIVVTEAVARRGLFESVVVIRDGQVDVDEVIRWLNVFVNWFPEYQDEQFKLQSEYEDSEYNSRATTTNGSLQNSMNRKVFNFSASSRISTIDEITRLFNNYENVIEKVLEPPKHPKKTSFEAVLANIPNEPLPEITPENRAKGLLLASLYLDNFPTEEPIPCHDYTLDFNLIEQQVDILLKATFDGPRSRTVDETIEELEHITNEIKPSNDRTLEQDEDENESGDEYFSYVINIRPVKSNILQARTDSESFSKLKNYQVTSIPSSPSGLSREQILERRRLMQQKQTTSMPILYSGSSDNLPRSINDLHQNS